MLLNSNTSSLKVQLEAKRKMNKVGLLIEPANQKIFIIVQHFKHTAIYTYSVVPLFTQIYCATELKHLYSLRYIRQLPWDDGWKESMLGESTLTITSSPAESSLELSSSAITLRCRLAARGGKGARAGAAGAGAVFLFIRLEPSDCTESRGRVLDDGLAGTFG